LRQRLMPAPPIKTLRDPVVVEEHIHTYWISLISKVQEEHLEPLGLDL
jgi:hypothetical protein